MKTLLLSILLMSAGAFAAAPAVVGSAQLRIDSNGVFGFAYDARNQNLIHGEFWSNGTKTSDLAKNSRGQWSGRYGRYVVTADPAVVSADGKKMTVHIVSVPGGIYDYTITRDRHQNIEINEFVGSGNLASASLNKSGSDFSVSGSQFSFGVSEGRGNAGHYTGSVLPNRGGFGSTVTMSAGGTLYLPTLFNSDPALFIVLYVLPFHESAWPGQ